MTEDEVAFAVLRIADEDPNGIATFEKIYSELPKILNLSEGDRTPSHTRNGEPLWMQLVRNIQSHHSSDGNYIERGLLEHKSREGYKITEQGRQFLKGRGY